MNEPRLACMILETERDEQGWIVCIAKENEHGYFRSSWRWDCDLETAERLADKRNEMMGLTKKDAMMIIVSTMRRE